MRNVSLYLTTTKKWYLGVDGVKIKVRIPTWLATRIIAFFTGRERVVYLPHPFVSIACVLIVVFVSVGLVALL